MHFLFDNRFNENDSRKRSLAETAYDQIYRKIISLDYQPGQNLEEKRLMTDLDIGRTPIREALLRLESVSMVTSEPNKGFVVRPITLQTTRAVFEALEILELGVARLAVNHDNREILDQMARVNESLRTAVDQVDIMRVVELNHDFHMLFAQCSWNGYLMRALLETRCEANRLAYLSGSTDSDGGASLASHYASVLDQHQQFIELIGARNPDSLRSVIRVHLDTFKRRIIHYLTA